MNSPEQFEAELKQLRPAKPSSAILNQVLDRLGPAQPPHNPVRKSVGWNVSLLLRWLGSAGAVAVLCAGLFWKHETSHSRLSTASSPPPVLKADKIEIDRRLVADFDAVAKLPSGVPVRFRCEQWMDKVRWRDSARGLVVEQTTPRLEIVPVRFETY